MLLFDTAPLRRADRAEAFRVAMQEAAAPCRIEHREEPGLMQARISLWSYGRAAVLSRSTTSVRVAPLGLPASGAARASPTPISRNREARTIRRCAVVSSSLRTSAAGLRCAPDPQRTASPEYRRGGPKWQKPGRPSASGNRRKFPAGWQVPEAGRA